jgi:hypothetical protein
MWNYLNQRVVTSDISNTERHTGSKMWDLFFNEKENIFERGNISKYLKFGRSTVPPLRSCVVWLLGHNCKDSVKRHPWMMFILNISDLTYYVGCFHRPQTWSDNKVRELIAVEVLHTSLQSLWSPSKYSPWEAIHRSQHLVQVSEQFWNWFCGMAFRAALVLALMSSKCLPFNMLFIFRNRKKLYGG